MMLGDLIEALDVVVGYNSALVRELRGIRKDLRGLKEEVGRVASNTVR